MPQKPWRKPSDTPFRDKQLRAGKVREMAGDPKKDFQRYEDRRDTAHYARVFDRDLQRGKSVRDASDAGERYVATDSGRLHARDRMNDARKEYLKARTAYRGGGSRRSRSRS